MAFKMTGYSAFKNTDKKKQKIVHGQRLRDLGHVGYVGNVDYFYTGKITEDPSTFSTHGKTPVSRRKFWGNRDKPEAE